MNVDTARTIYNGYFWDDHLILKHSEALLHSSIVSSLNARHQIRPVFPVGLNLQSSHLLFSGGCGAGLRAATSRAGQWARLLHSQEASHVAGVIEQRRPPDAPGGLGLGERRDGGSQGGLLLGAA